MLLRGMFRRLTAAAFVWCLSLGVATAAPILHVHDSQGNLGTVDVTTGTVSVIGNMGTVMTDIAFSPSGALYAISFTSLYSVDASTGAATLIGNLGLGSANNALVFGTDGTLYGAGGLNFFTVNTTTGAGTLVGSTGVGSAGDLAFNSGTLYLSSTANQLVEINTATGAGSIIGSFGFSNVFGLATGADGVLYGVAGTQVFSVDTLTGAGTLMSNYGGQGLGDAFGSSFITEAVPEPATLALLGIGMVGLLSRRRR